MGKAWLKNLFPNQDMAFYMDSTGGLYKGYGLSVKKKINSAVLKMTGDTSKIPEKDFKEWLDAQEKDFGKFLKKEKASTYILLEIKDPNTKGKFVENVRGLAESLHALMEKYKAVSCCEACGKAYAGFYYEQKEPRLYCGECGKLRQKETEKLREEKKKESSRVLLGILGALIGSLPGAALWAGIVIYGLYNGLAGSAAVVIVTGAVIGYRLLGKKLGRAALISVSLISAAAMFLANHLVFAWLIYDGYAYMFDQTYSMLLRTVVRWMSTNYLFDTFIPGVSSYGISLIVGAVLGLITGVVCIIIVRTSFKRRYEFKMISDGKQ